MTDQFSEQEIHNLFQQHLPPVELPPELANAVRQRVMDEVAVTLMVENATVQSVGESAAPVSVLDSRQRTSWRAAAAPRPSFINSLQERFSWWRFATGLALTGATAAVVFLFVVALPGVLPQDGDNNSLSPGAEVLPIEEAASESASILVQGGTATILRAGAVIGDIAPGGTAELYPGDGLVTLSGSAVIEYFDGQRTFVEPESRVELVLLTQNGERTDVVLAVHLGQTQNEVSASADSRFEVTGPATRVRAAEGAFKLNVPSDKNKTNIEVLAGSVNVESNGQVAVIDAGNQVSVISGEPLVVQPVASGEPVAQEIAAVLEEGSAEAPTPTPVPTYTPAPTDTATAEPTATPTEEPTATATAVATETNTPLPTATPTHEPTETPRPLPTFTPTPTATPTPRTVRLIVPNDGVSGSGDEIFQWRADFQLADDEAFELIFWKPGQNPLAQGFGLALPTQRTRLSVDLRALDNRLGGLLDPGEYRWGVRVVKTTEPYERVEFLGDSRLFRYTTATTGLPGGDIGSGE